MVGWPQNTGLGRSVVVLSFMAAAWLGMPAVPSGAVADPGAARKTTGRISGQVLVGGPITVRKPRFRLYTDYGPGSIAAPIAAEPAKQQVLVYLDSVPRDVLLPNRLTPPAMQQHDERFVPHVLPVVEGSVVEFPNTDPFFHNVFSLSSAKSFDLGRYAQGESRSVRFDAPGIVQVFCHIHSDMSAYIVVLRNPFYTTPDADGRFVLEGVPPGSYEVVGWHERARPVSHRVTVAPGETTEIQIVIPTLDKEPSG
jgi:hypothetical protein